MYLCHNNHFTPSLLYSMDDYLLNFAMLKMVVRYYLQDYVDTEGDYFLSPIFTPDHILEQFPRTEVFIPERDPLRDDALRFCAKVLKAQGKLRIRFFKYLCHGLLNMSIKNGLPESFLFERKVRSCLNKMFAKLEIEKDEIKNVQIKHHNSAKF